VLDLQTNTINVHFIDYGNKETIAIKVAERMDSQFFSIPPLAERFVVAGLSPANGISWTPAEFDQLEKTLLDTEFEAEIIGAGVTGFPSLINLVNVGFVSLTAVPSLVSRWPAMSTAQQFAVGKCYTVLVTHYESVLNFYVQDSCGQDTLDRFHDSLTSAMASGGGKSHLEPECCWPGTLCVARYKGSDQFYRAVVRKVDSQGSYVVIFIDYGDSSTVSIRDLFPIDAEFLRLPVQALRCCVSEQSAMLGRDQLHSAYTAGCPVYIRIGAVSSVHHIVEINFDSRSAVGQPVVQLPSPVGNGPSVTSSALAVPKYLKSSLAPDVWHSVSISSVKPDGTFYVQLLDEAVRLNVLMLELAAMPLLPINGAIVDGMACVIRSPADRCIYRAHVCILCISCPHFIVTLVTLSKCQMSETFIGGTVYREF